MELKKMSQDENELQLLVTGTDTAFMNALRRTIINNVPVLAIENVSIYENTSVVNDEMLSHRLGLVAIRATEALTADDTAKFGLEKEGPAMVYSGDMICVSGNAQIPDQKIPLVKLGKGQRVRLELEAVAKTGSEHAKWQPALVAYHQNVHLKTENVKNPEMLVKAFPESLELKAKKVFLADSANVRVASEIRDKFPDQVSLEYDDNSFVLTLESHKGLTNIEIMEAAISALREKNTSFKEALKSL